ncbi:MAG: hypothetical protein M3Q65_21105 [Chloroflexota bacterium]|nr:hypothetical protein [Chloroflexota bacterium]
MAAILVWVQIDFGGSVRYPFLRGEGIVMRVSGPALAQPAELQSFWYDPFKLGMDPTQAAAEDAAAIAPDGTPPGGAPAWAGPPHFFRKEHALVLYVGDDPALLAILTDLLGPQFAGR